MTFEMSADQQAAREKARVFATAKIQPHAAEVDRTATVPADLARDAAGMISAGDAMTCVVVVEELASVSATIALAATAPNGAVPLGLSGVRGAVAPEPSVRGQLVLAATALGLGRAALEAAVAELRQSHAKPGKEAEKPHWVMADAATELQAARMLTLRAAQAVDEGSGDVEVALARLMASAAAHGAVDAALRIAGPAALREGSLLERLARDIRAVGLVNGTEEEQRTTAAEGLLPQ